MVVIQRVASLPCPVGGSSDGSVQEVMMVYGSLSVEKLYSYTSQNENFIQELVKRGNQQNQILGVNGEYYLTV